MSPARILAIAMAVLTIASCGKRGNPLPPLRPVPARIADVAAVRSPSGVEISFTVPATNTDGTTPAAIDRVEVYGVVVAIDAPPPLAAVIVSDAKNLRAQVPVRAPGVSGPTGAPAAPGQGERALAVDRAADLASAATAGRLYYVAVPIVGSGRGRRGPVSSPLVIPMGPLPTAPTNVALEHDEKDLRVTWLAAPAPGRTFRVVRTTSAGAAVDDAGPAPVVTPTGATLPVVFGREACVSVRTVDVTGAVTVEGDASRPACLTPVDRYAPQAPTGLQVVQEGGAVTLVWDAADATDLGGYVVLRGVGAATVLQPLMRTPIRETTFRDTTVVVGTTYVYAVYAADNAPTPNVSQLSTRQTVTVR